METEVFLGKLADVLEIDQEEISDQLRLTPEIWDSLVVLATIALIDKQFGITVPTKELTACTSVGALLALVQQRAAQSEPTA